MARAHPQSPAGPRIEWAPAVQADHINALYNRGSTLMGRKQFEEALRVFELVLAHEPNHLGALNDCGGVLARLGRPDAAIACYDRALALAPQTAELHINKGTALRAQNRLEQALAMFAAAARIAPARAEAHYNASLVRLSLGDFAAGWKDYEWRWRKADWASRRRDFPAPLWLGREVIAGKTILLHAEQGFGDTIQFVRYVPLVARRGARVILEVQPALKELLGGIDGATSLVANGEKLPPFELRCPLMSLPLAFATNLATIPADFPYLRAAPERVAKWRELLPNSGRLRVGVCWAGSSAHLNDHNRSIPLERFAAILSVPHVDFVSLQTEVDDAHVAVLRQHGVAELARHVQDFADTAAVVATLDLIIAVDTSVAHLAGALGKAVALLLPFAPDFRWLLDRTDSPWYPTMRLFRQSAIGDWDAALARLRSELAAVARRRVEQAATARG